jgi:metal-responsive CopG/Arc/MetJ family transcriptional regulator
MVMAKRRTKMVSVYLYVSDVDFIDEEARKNDMNRSDVIRKIIRDHVEKKREEKENA